MAGAIGIVMQWAWGWGMVGEGLIGQHAFGRSDMGWAGVSRALESFLPFHV